MSRPREFDTNAAIDAAMHVFWEQGIHRTSIDDLLSATGLSRSSIYNTFGSKDALFEAVVQRYVERQVSGLQQLLVKPSFRTVIEHLFLGAVNGNNDGRGCLLVNCAAGLMQMDAREQNLLRAGFERMVSLLAQRIAHGQSHGELQPELDPVIAATLVCTTLSGLRIFRKAGLQSEQLEKSVRLAVDCLWFQLALAGNANTGSDVPPVYMSMSLIKS